VVFIAVAWLAFDVALGILVGKCIAFGLGDL
jgi:hypothetical protein